MPRIIFFVSFGFHFSVTWDFMSVVEERVKLSGAVAAFAAIHQPERITLER